MAAVLSMMVLAAIALAAGAFYLWNREGMRRQAVLMLVLVAVIAANIAILTVPVGDGKSVAEQTPR
jgi:hypothetical protein